MSAEKVVHALLAAAAPVTALVADRIYPGELPQGTVLPALGISHISGTERFTIDASAPFVLMQTRIEITVLAYDYPMQKSLINKVRAALNYQRGTVATVPVVSVVRDVEGPDMRDSDLGVYSQTIDFMVTWNQANP